VIISASVWLERLEVLTLFNVPISLAAALVGPLVYILTAGVMTPLVIVILNQIDLMKPP
jgi:hypothetical protein